MTETKPAPKRGGMAGLAASRRLDSRINTLAQRSTGEELLPAAAPLALVPQTSAAPETATPPGLPAADEPRNEPSRPAGPPPPHKPTDRTVTARQPLTGPEGRLEASGDQVVKWTLELAPQLVSALNRWELDETERLGERVFRERLVDLALDALPTDTEEILALVAGLPPALRKAEPRQFGTRVRFSVREKLVRLRPKLRDHDVRGVRVRVRDVTNAGVYRYLVALGIEVETEKPRNPKTETIT